MQMSDGYDTVMYEGGDNLSGGQKQRINLARAVVRNTPILILDEPITGLDARTEAKINAALYRLTQGKTTFIIAHKFSTIASADKASNC
jgi:ABC-type multidrug transport system fused ATPase/permease subunit